MATSTNNTLLTPEEQLEQKKKADIAASDEYYDGLIGTGKTHRKNLQDNAAEQAKVLEASQDAETQFTLDKIEQQRSQAKKDYIKEQSAAYADYKKEKDPYGEGAEKMADSGMLGTGYSESVRADIYRTYQNRVATARASLNEANVAYDNMMKEAKLSNSAKKAEIALQLYQSQLELALEGFQYEVGLTQAKLDSRRDIESNYVKLYEQLKEDDKSNVGAKVFGAYYEAKDVLAKMDAYALSKNKEGALLFCQDLIASGAVPSAVFDILYRRFPDERKEQAEPLWSPHPTSPTNPLYKQHAYIINK